MQYNEQQLMQPGDEMHFTGYNFDSDSAVDKHKQYIAWRFPNLCNVSS